MLSNNKKLSLPIVYFIIIFVAWNTSNLITESKLINSIFNFFPILLLSFFLKFKIYDVAVVCFFFLFIFLNLAINIPADNEYLFSQINNYIQIPIYTLFFVTFFKTYHFQLINFVKNNAMIFILIFISTIVLFYIRHDIFLFEFTLLNLLILVAFSPLFSDDQTKAKNIYFISLLFLLAFLTTRLSFIFSLLFFLTLYLYKNIFYIFSLRFLGLLLIIYPFIFAFLLDNEILEFFIEFDHNTYFRLQSLMLSGDLIKNDIISILVGKGFGFPYRALINNDLSTLHHFNDLYSINTIPNHNSFFDFFYRFGLIGFIPLVYIIIRSLFINVDNNIYAKKINTITFFIIFQLSFNPWAEDQNQLIMLSFLIAFLIYLLSFSKINKKTL